MRTFGPLLSLLLLACGSSETGHSASAADEAPDTEEPADEEPTPREAPPASEGMEVAAWQALLSEYATEDGGFRYAALRESEEDRAALNGVAAQVASAEPDGWSRDARLAFYINAYNALTVKAVVDRWPIESVMRVEGFFDSVTHQVAGEEITLNHLENEIIRSDDFAEPRIHFAVNCASVGCPRLSRTAYTAANLEEQLTERAREFVRRTSRVSEDRVELSQIFEWFAADFERVGGVRAFVAAQLEGEDAATVRDEATTIAHFEYDWAVNARR